MIYSEVTFVAASILILLSILFILAIRKLYRWVIISNLRHDDLNRKLDKLHKMLSSELSKSTSEVRREIEAKHTIMETSLSKAVSQILYQISLNRTEFSEKMSDYKKH
jgi:hypothetical protein